MYNNPYMYQNMYMYEPKPGLIGSIKNIGWKEFLNNTQKTLNLVNQIIPLYNQVKPIWHNMRSFTKLLNAYNSNDNISINNNMNTSIKKENSNQPTFFIN